MSFELGSREGPADLDTLACESPKARKCARDSSGISFGFGQKSFDAKSC
jgi:hypothetical protein